MHVCLFTVVMPWIFGPYAQQLSMIAEGLLAQQHQVYWIGSSYRGLDERRYTPEEIIKAHELPKGPEGKLAALCKRLRFLGIQNHNGNYVPSSINRVLTKFNIDVRVLLHAFLRGSRVASSAPSRPAPLSQPPHPRRERARFRRSSSRCRTSTSCTSMSRGSPCAARSRGGPTTSRSGWTAGTFT